MLQFAYRRYVLPDCFGRLLKNGWKFDGIMWPGDQCPNHSIRDTRRVGDRYTWIIPLDTRPVQRSKISNSVLENSYFGIVVSESDTGSLVHNTACHDDPFVSHNYEIEIWIYTQVYLSIRI